MGEPYRARAVNAMACMGPGRREFLQWLAMAALAGCGAATGRTETTAGAGSARGGRGRTPARAKGEIPRRKLGKTGVEVSALALGGHHLGRAPDEAAAVRLVHEAIDAGVTFMDNAWDYHDGKSEEWMGKALVGKRDQVFLMTKVCSHGRSGRVALAQLDDSLRRLKTDHLDLWQIHEVVHEDEPALHHEEEGAVWALDRAREQGKVRFVGFTGHKDPTIHRDMLDRGYAFDAVQLPLSAFDASYRSFEREILPILERRGIAAIGMKSFNGTARALEEGKVTPEEALRYVLSLPVATVVSGMESPEILRQNVGIAQDFEPMSPEEMDALRARLRPLAADGSYELYKSSKRFDGGEGQRQRDLRTKSKRG
jgi:uncharacterized protein